MRTAAARFWRSKGRLSFKEDNVKKALYLEGRRKLRSSEINKKVAEEFDRTKGPGAAKLACSLGDNFIGVSKVKVQKILSTDKSLYHRNAKFMNKATLKPIRAKDQGHPTSIFGKYLFGRLGTI